MTRRTIFNKYVDGWDNDQGPKHSLAILLCTKLKLSVFGKIELSIQYTRFFQVAYFLKLMGLNRFA